MGSPDVNIAGIFEEVFLNNGENSIPDFRKKYIASICRTIKEESGSEVDLGEIFKRKVIVIIEGPKVIVPLTCFLSTLSEDRPPIVFLPDYGSPIIRRWVKAHELGHGILHSDVEYGIYGRIEIQEEQEANYFARNLVARPPLCSIVAEEIERGRKLNEEPLKSAREEFMIYVAKIARETVKISF